MYLGIDLGTSATQGLPRHGRAADHRLGRGAAGNLAAPASVVGAGTAGLGAGAARSAGRTAPAARRRTGGGARRGGVGPDARRHAAGRPARRAAAGHPVERHPLACGVRRARGRGAAGPADHRQPGDARLHRAETGLAAQARAGIVQADPHGDAAQGLPHPAPEWRAEHRDVRRRRHRLAGCGRASLVRFDARSHRPVARPDAAAVRRLPAGGHLACRTQGALGHRRTGGGGGRRRGRQTPPRGWGPVRWPTGRPRSRSAARA